MPNYCQSKITALTWWVGIMERGPWWTLLQPGNLPLRRPQPRSHIKTLFIHISDQHGERGRLVGTSTLILNQNLQKIKELIKECIAQVLKLTQPFLMGLLGKPRRTCTLTKLELFIGTYSTVTSPSIKSN